MNDLHDNPVVRTSLRRPIMVLMALLAALVLGVIALARIPLELIPSGFSPPFMNVTVPYADATAHDVEEKIARPLEQALATTPGIDQIRSTSSAGQARITLQFEGEADMDIAYREVRDRVARVRPDLPDDVQRVDIRKESGASIPVAVYGIIWDDAIADPHAIVERHLMGAIERIDGVGLVNLWGQKDPEIRIEVDRALADAAGLELFELVQTLSAANFTLASGSVEDPEGKYLLRSLAAYASPKDIEELMVTPQGLRLRDIATVTYGRPIRERYDRYNGKPSMVMFVVKESQANTVQVCDKIKEAVEEAASHPELQQFDIEPVFIQGDTIRFSLQQVVDSGLQGGALALLVLIFFLRRVRLTMVIALAIPLSLFLSLPVMYFTGQTINLVSLIGLMICIGLVVDNSVVVAENIARYRRRGLGPYAAALHGAGEVALAITLATMTTLVVFLPASLLSSGPTQFFMVRMVTPVCVSLLASLFVALVLIPLASATVMADRVGAIPKAPRHRVIRAIMRIDGLWKAVLGRAYEATFGRLNRAYVGLLRRAMRRRMDVVVLSLLAMASMTIPAMNVQCTPGENFGTRNVNVFYSMPSDTTLEEANEFFTGIEELLARDGHEYGIVGQYIGFDDGFGRVQVFFDTPKPDDPPFKQIGREVVDMLPNRPGWDKSSKFAESDGARSDTFRIAVFGDEHDRVQEARRDLERALVGVPGVVGLQNEGQDTRQRDELELQIDRGAAERYGVAAGLVGNTVAYAIRGSPLPRFRAPTREVDVRVSYREDDRKDVDQILGYRVPTTQGGSVALQVLADKEIGEGRAQLVRSNKRVAAVIGLELDPDDRMATVRRLRKFIKGYRLPEGLSFDADHERRQIDDTQRDLFGALVLGTIFIFLLMGFLFESFVLPLSVLPSIPLSFVGVWWFLFATGENIDALAGIGIILLLGVVVNNAIVLVDFVGAARRAGLGRSEAILQAGQLRFRPILMTALTTIGGMLPLAFAPHTGEGIPYGPFGKTLVGGMITATVLTLVVVPVTYTFLDDLRESALGWLHRLMGAAGRSRSGPK